ncbi:hypothetical protein FMUND_10550 [Fusarium mundagurra]|uniref:Uncharacterized protein n=1 Tax=Fusarium mundagurra TaxID=1567541 RepID=A0A8H5YBS1_9HYPO|nr:hypothetical protein FMUND_10550 [Fusarium mundagurra]
MDYSSILSKPKSFFGKQKVWMARGEDLALFNTHRPNIQNLLRHFCIPESSHYLWIGLYRVGITEDEAKTFVVVSCPDRRIRKLTRDILSSRPIFQPGQAPDRFKVISKATLPETACEPRQTMQDEQDVENETGLWKRDEGKNIAKDEYKTIRISPSITGDSYLCRQVQARQVSGKGELTVAHVVNFEKEDIHDTIESTTDDWDDWDEESDHDINSGCSVDEYVASWDISTSRNSTPDASDNDIPSSLSSGSAFEVATQLEGRGAAITAATSTDEEPKDEPVHPPSSPPNHLSERPVFEEFLIDHASPYLGFAPGSENCQISTEMDYLLIPTNTDLQAGVSTSKSAELIQTSEAFDLQGKTEARPVIIATASLGYVEGVVFPASSLLRPPGSKDFQTLYCIESHNSMAKGTSGSAVFDKRTGLLAGYLVLGCPEKNIWYMVPIVNMLNDLEVRFGQKGNCQIQIDVYAAMSSNVLDTVDANFEERPQLSQGSLHGPAIQQSQESPKYVISRSPKPTQWERIDKPITSILKGLQGEVPVTLDQWGKLFVQETHYPVSDRARWRELERVFSKAMALVLLYTQTVPERRGKMEILETRDNLFTAIVDSETMATCDHGGKDSTQPTAWVLDVFRPLMNKGKALDKRELFALLQGKNLSSHNSDNEIYTPRCLYIKNPNPKGIMALYKVSSQFPMETFQELLFSYVTKEPDPMIKLIQDTWLGSTYFSIQINVPFLVSSSRVELDRRSGTRNPGFRRGYSLSFLYQEQPRDFQDQNTSSFADRSYLYPVCLNDGLADDTTMLSTTAEGDSEDITNLVSPRAYALEALASSLEKVAGYHHELQLDFENRFKSLVLEIMSSYNSRLLEKLETFLSKDLCSSPDDPLGNPLWASFHRDPCSSKSLPRIRKMYSELSDAQSHLEILDGRVKDLMIKQTEVLVDNGSPRWFTLAAVLAVMIALIYQMANN